MPSGLLIAVTYLLDTNLLVYPFDARPELRNPMYYSRSAWQLRTLEVR